jgi:hypothetical protein
MNGDQLHYLLQVHSCRQPAFRIKILKYFTYYIDAQRKSLTIDVSEEEEKEDVEDLEDHKEPN